MRRRDFLSGIVGAIVLPPSVDAQRRGTPVIGYCRSQFVPGLVAA
jgi:hypothetical protein